MITLVYAQELEGGIGLNNEMPWYLPNDFKHFKSTTMGHTILMGRKTFESMNQRLLPGRKSVVLTTQANYGKDIEGLVTIHTIDEALNLAKNTDLMVIGGAEIYKAMLPYADQIIRTVIEERFDVDTYVSEINRRDWELIKTVDGIIDEKNHYPHRFETWKRKNKGE